MKMQKSQPSDNSMNIATNDKSIKKNSTYYVSDSLFNLKLSDLKNDKLSVNKHIKNMDNAESGALIMLKNNLESKDSGVSFVSKSMYTNKCSKLHSKRKSIPVTPYLTNSSTKAVLFERSIEIKDLESKVKYLQNKIKEMVYRILNLEENLNRDQTIHKQHKRDNEQLQLKYEELKNKISGEQTCILLDNDINHNSVTEDSSQNFTPVLSQRCLESEHKGLKKTPVMQKSEETVLGENSVSKVNKALLHTLKRYQDMRMSESSNIEPLEGNFSHLKSLPPLMKAPRRHPQFINSVQKDKCASFIDKNVMCNSNIIFKIEELPKDYHSSLNILGSDTEISKTCPRISIGSALIRDDYKQSSESIKHASVSQFSPSWLDDL